MFGGQPERASGGPKLDPGSSQVESASPSGRRAAPVGEGGKAAQNSVKSLLFRAPVHRCAHPIVTFSLLYETHQFPRGRLATLDEELRQLLTLVKF